MIMIKIQDNPFIEKPIDKIQIPDLWPIAANLPTKQKEQVLEAWHLCHSFCRHIRRNETE